MSKPPPTTSTCNICFGNETTENPIIRPCSCSLEVHVPCLTGWLERKETCPICRKPVLLKKLLKEPLEKKQEIQEEIQVQVQEEIQVQVQERAKRAKEETNRTNNIVIESRGQSDQTIQSFFGVSNKPSRSRTNKNNTKHKKEKRKRRSKRKIGGAPPTKKSVVPLILFPVVITIILYLYVARSSHRKAKGRALYIV